MNNWWFCTIFGVCLLTGGVFSQRVAPGVNPQKYDYDYGNRNQPQYQPPHQHQQQKQQQPQYQAPNQRQYQRSPPQINPNVYQERVPEVPNVQYQPQQQQQQQQQQQPPQQQYQQQQAPQQARSAQHQQAGSHGHGHGHSGSPQSSKNVLNAANVHQEKDHIAEHMEVPIDTSKMTDEELQFHYFKMHDTDKNGKLDGCELTKSMIHWHENDSPEANTGKKTYNDEELEHTVDEVLRLMDRNRDGFIDYSEYKMSEAEMENSGVKSP